MLVYSGAASPQHADNRQVTPTTFWQGTCLNKASFTSAFQSLYSSQSEASSVRLHPTAAVLFSLVEGVQRRRGPLWGAVLLLASTFRAAAAERGAEACADGLSEQNKHDAVGCALRRVANTLEGQSITCPLMIQNVNISFTFSRLFSCFYFLYLITTSAYFSYSYIKAHSAEGHSGFAFV